MSSHSTPSPVFGPTTTHESTQTDAQNASGKAGFEAYDESPKVSPNYISSASKPPDLSSSEMHHNVSRANNRENVRSFDARRRGGAQHARGHYPERTKRERSILELENHFTRRSKLDPLRPTWKQDDIQGEDDSENQDFLSQDNPEHSHIPSRLSSLPRRRRTRVPRASDEGISPPPRPNTRALASFDRGYDCGFQDGQEAPDIAFLVKEFLAEYSPWTLFKVCYLFFYAHHQQTWTDAGFFVILALQCLMA